MFTMSYAEPDSAVLDLLMNVTWWPGWLLTAGLILAGLKGLLTTSR